MVRFDSNPTNCEIWWSNSRSFMRKGSSDSHKFYFIYVMLFYLFYFIYFILFILFSRLPTPKWEPEAGVFGETTPKMEVWESDLHFLGVVSPSPYKNLDG